MSKEVKKCECLYCESSYKLMFDLNTTSGYPKFCSFCSEPLYEEKVEYEEKLDDE